MRRRKSKRKNRKMKRRKKEGSPMPRSVWVEGPLALGHHWDRQFSGQEQQGHCVCVSDFSHRSELSVLKHQETHLKLIHVTVRQPRHRTLSPDPTFGSITYKMRKPGHRDRIIPNYPEPALRCVIEATHQIPNASSWNCPRNTENVSRLIFRETPTCLCRDFCLR